MRRDEMDVEFVQLYALLKEADAEPTRR